MTRVIDSLERIGVPSCAVNGQGHIVGWNQHAAQFFNRSPESVVGTDWHAVVKTVRTPWCCALCRTRESLQNAEAAPPIDATLSIDGFDQKVIMLPFLLPTPIDEILGFLILTFDAARELVSRPVEPIPINSPIRQVDRERSIGTLTPRERQILACVVEGFDARGIAGQLGITHATARNYVQRILTKLGVRNKAEAVSVALTHNLLAS